MSVFVGPGVIEATTTGATEFTVVMFLRIFNENAPFSGEIGGGYRPPTNRAWLLAAGVWPNMVGSPYGPAGGRAPVRAEGTLNTGLRGTWQGSVSVQVPDGVWASCGVGTHEFRLERAAS